MVNNFLFNSNKKSINNSIKSQRQLKVGEELRHLISNALLRSSFYDEHIENNNITITEVNVSPDLRNAKVYVMPLGGKKKLDVLKHLLDKKLNVISHIGVTPQSYKNFNKIKVLGKTNKEKQNLLKLAKESETLGAKAVLLECVTANTAKLITENISIPTIGIGASRNCDGQVLVFDDLINLSINDKKPKFVKNYFNFNKVASNVVKKYNREVKLKKFPSTKFTYN